MSDVLAVEALVLLQAAPDLRKLYAEPLEPSFQQFKSGRRRYFHEVRAAAGASGRDRPGDRS